MFGPGTPDKAVDGNTDGDFGKGSVTCTLNAELASKAGINQPNAWWEVDLGASVPIDAMEIWNRTDGSSQRLADFWIFVSDTPFSASDTPATLAQKAGVRKNHQTVAPEPSIRIAAVASQAAEAAVFDNGYLRVLGPANSAVVSGFRTDGATAFDLDLNASQPVKVQYLFWPNDRLMFYLQGTRVDAKIEGRLQTVSVPSGHSHLEIRYVNWPLRFFLFLYFFYALAIPAALAMPLLARFRRPTHLGR